MILSSAMHTVGCQGRSREFHVSRPARDRYQFDQELFSARGTAVFADFRGARLFAQRMNQQRDLTSHPEQAVRAGQINAMGLIHELSHLLIQSYRRRLSPDLFARALRELGGEVGSEAMEDTLTRFGDQFPALSVYTGRQSLDSYLADTTDGDPNREVVLEEALLLWLANVNPAFSPYLELFDDGELETDTAYLRIIAGLDRFLAGEPDAGPGGQSLLDVLQAPAKASPHSLAGQLEYMIRHWGEWIDQDLLRLLSSLDLLREEEKPVFLGPGPTQVVEFGHVEDEPERFSPDLDWMPKVVMLAKNAYVWLDQLSRQYQTHFTRLDQIPDAELDRLAGSGFNGLWLIGLWERSKASRRIKQMMGNPEAVASAYSLFDYQIAADLGGYDSYQDLRNRAWQRGIRLASDMVPNHVGIDGRWVMEHPDWFIALDESPFPSYTFNGPDLSNDQRVGIYLEDHYYDRSDAAVVFKRVDRWSDSAKYIYHGNDGTSMPWNDTAQLNYLNPEVREGVIQTILHVARMFPIIRFDAAMTLAKRHYQRLWFPEPGSGGDIASRAEHGLTKAQFDEAFPNEFWREVVDRVATEVPGTLLLAEAFWLMEGYFVRTLGMHRVYNSAFMNMLKQEENAKFRSVIKNTVEFEPEILKRYVNFMNNPDEDTAVAQFGKDGKYFGVCTMLSTLPGLPMFGHGQVEGYTEKYGMEYRRAYYDETPDPWLVRRHEREIFPLLHKRYLFAEVENFLLYDFYNPDGTVNEDVFAYSNRAGAERALVVYHNKFAEARGWIRLSAAYAVKTGDGEKRLEQKTLGQGLVLQNDPAFFTILRDQATGLEFVRNNRELHEQGMYVELGAFKCHVFLDIRQVEDLDGRYAALAAFLRGGGVPSVEEALVEMRLRPVLEPFRQLANVALFRRLLALAIPPAPPVADDGDAEVPGDESAPVGEEREALLDDVEGRMAGLLSAINAFTGTDGDVASLARQTRLELAAALDLPRLADRAPESAAVATLLADHLEENEARWATLFGWLFTHGLGKLADPADPIRQSLAWFDDLYFSRRLMRTMEELGLAHATAARAVDMVRLLINQQGWVDADGAYAVLRPLLLDRQGQALLGINRFQRTLWFNKEAFEEARDWLLTTGIVDALTTDQPGGSSAAVAARANLIEELNKAGTESGYQVRNLLRALL